VVGNATVHVFDARAALFAQGDEARAVPVMVHGYVKLSAVTACGCVELCPAAAVRAPSCRSIRHVVSWLEVKTCAGQLSHTGILVTATVPTVLHDVAYSA